MKKPLLLLALACSLPASAASIGRTYIPSAGSAELAALEAGLKASGYYTTKIVSRDMLHPMALSLTPMEVLKLEALTKAPLVDKGAINVIVNQAIDRAAVYAAEASLKVITDEAEGKIADDDLRGSESFAQRYLTTFGLYLKPQRKAEFLQAAAKMEQRRRVAEGEKQVRLDLIMRKMANTLSAQTDPDWNIAVYDKTAQAQTKAAVSYLRLVRPARALPVVKRRFLQRIDQAVRAKDEKAVKRLIKAAYEALEEGLGQGLFAQSKRMPGPREDAFIESAEAQTRELHGAIHSVLRKSPYSDLLAISEKRRDALFKAIAKSAQLSRWHAGDIDADLPRKAFSDAVFLQDTTDGSIAVPLSKINAFYRTILDNARLGSPEYLAHARRKMARGFDGSVPTFERIAAVWKQALASSYNREKWVALADSYQKKQNASLITAVASYVLASVLSALGLWYVPAALFLLMPVAGLCFVYFLFKKNWARDIRDGFLAGPEKAAP